MIFLILILGLLLKLSQNKQAKAGSKKKRNCDGDGGGEGFSNRPGWLGITSWEVWLCLPAHGSPSLAVALITCGGVESRLQREGRDSDFQQNEAHKATLVASTPAPSIYFTLLYPAALSDGRIR